MQIVFVPGAGGSSLHFHYQTQYFEGADAVDLPGHPDGRPCDTIRGYTDWLHAYIEDKGYRDVVLAGHSMGGAIALQYAFTYPESALGLVLIATGARLRVAESMLEQSRAAETDPSPWLESYQLSLSGVEPSLRSRLVERRMEVGPAVQLNDLLCCDAFDVMDRIHLIQVPTLVISGSRDDVTPVKYASYLANRIPNARSEIIEGATHAIVLEKPTEVNGAMERFVGGLNRPL